MNRYLLAIYLAGVPIVAFTALYVSGITYLWSGLPFAWANHLGLGRPSGFVFVFGGRGHYFDWFAFLLDVLFYTGWGYALLGCYKLLRDSIGAG